MMCDVVAIFHDQPFETSKMNRVTSIKPTKKELLPLATEIFQTENGTVYYWKFTKPKMLHVKWQGKKVKASLPNNILDVDKVQGNALYLKSTAEVNKASFDPNIEMKKWKHHQKLYKAVFTPPDTFAVSNVPVEFMAAELNEYGVFTRMRAGKKYAYEMWQDPDRDGIHIDLPDEETNGKELIGIYRQKALFLSTTSPLISAQKFGANAIILEAVDDETSWYWCDSSKFIYMARGLELHTLDTNTMQFLPIIRVIGIDEISNIAGVYNRVITMEAKYKDDDHLVTAVLSNGYYENTSNVLEKEDVKKMRERIKETVNATDIIDTNFDVVDQCCCSICSENFDSGKKIPRVLDCGHTFCELCIYNNKMRIDNKVKCPNCATVTPLPDGKILPKNFGLISMSEQLFKTRIEAKVACKSCNLKFSSTSVRMCIKEDCDMFNQLLCLNCVIDGGHGGHAVKYDVKMEKIRNDLREEVNGLCKTMQEKKEAVLEKTDIIVELCGTIKKNIADAEIPSQVLSQLDNIDSEQDAEEYKDIVRDLAKTAIDQCNYMIESFGSVINLLSDHVTDK